MTAKLPDNAATRSDETRGVIGILRLGVMVSAALIVIGLLAQILKGGAAPQALGGSFPILLSRVAGGVLRLEPAALVDAGLLVLLVTPMARVAAGIVASARARDAAYVIIGLVVLALVLYGLLSGQAAG